MWVFTNFIFLWVQLNHIVIIHSLHGCNCSQGQRGHCRTEGAGHRLRSPRRVTDDALCSLSDLISSPSSAVLKKQGKVNKMPLTESADT